MNITAISINGFAFLCLIVSFLKNKKKTRQGLKVALKSFFRILPVVFIIIILIGLLMGFVPQSQIAAIVGEKAGFSGVMVTALFGALLHIPALISFPLAASLLESGAAVTSVAAFITTLTMIGVVTLPLEIKELGKKFAILRNVLSFGFAVIIALIMGAIL